MGDRDAACARIGAYLQELDARLAVAESLTGGGVSACFSAAPQSSEWFLGGVVAYHKAVKFDLLRVPEGPVVSEEAAEAMARGVVDLLHADVGLAITGAGGPSPQDGQPPGTVWIAVVRDGALRTRMHRFDGEPPSVIDKAADAGVALLSELLGQDAG